MKVYFENSKKKEIFIGDADDDRQAMKIIKNFCSERGFEIYYTRMWIDGDNENRTHVDVGSHTEFFIIDKAN